MSDTKEQLRDQVLGTIRDLEGEGDYRDALSWLDDQLGIEQICYRPGTREMVDFEITSCTGGPHVEVTADRVQGWWGGDHVAFVYDDELGLFDLIEEFRQVIVDRTIVGMANKGAKLELDEKGLLVEQARRAIAEKVLARLEAAERYERKRQPLRVIIQSQARHIATFVRGDRSAYEPFIARW